jgi:hypothetical protein
MSRDYPNKTTITVDWEKSRGGWGMAVDESGDDLPNEIRIGIVNHLLRELKLKDYELHVERAR